MDNRAFQRIVNRIVDSRSSEARLREPSPAEGFRHNDHVRIDVEVMTREKMARTVEPRLHFVEDKSVPLRRQVFPRASR